MNSLKEKSPELCEEWSNKNSFSPEDLSYGSNKKVWWKGKCGHEWQALETERTDSYRANPEKGKSTSTK